MAHFLKRMFANTAALLAMWPNKLISHLFLKMIFFTP